MWPFDFTAAVNEALNASKKELKKENKRLTIKYTYLSLQLFSISRELLKQHLKNVWEN